MKGRTNTPGDTAAVVAVGLLGLVLGIKHRVSPTLLLVGA
jgi:hypothetical protein